MDELEVLLRWRLALQAPRDQRGAMQTLVRTLAAYRSPLTALSTYYASRQPGEAWFTAFAAVEWKLFLQAPCGRDSFVALP